MFEVIPKNTSTAAKRRIYFFLPTTDGITPATAKTGTAMLSFNGGVPAASTNSIVEVSAANQPGSYYLELTQTEANNTEGKVTGSLAPSGCARVQIEATIVNDDVYALSSTSNDIADAVLKRDLSAVTGESAKSLINWMRSGGMPVTKVSISGATATVYKEDGVTVAFTITLGGSTTITSSTR